MSFRSVSRFLSLGLTALLLCGCVERSSLPESFVPDDAMPESAGSSETATTAPSDEDSLRTSIECMTLQEKVAQLFVVTPDALLSDLQSSKTYMSEDLHFGLENYPVGGIVLFSDHLVGPDQVTDFLSDLQASSRIPLFLAVDEEGGTVARLAGHDGFDLPCFRSAGSIGASGDPADAREMGLCIGSYLSEYGFNMDFAPVADVNTNPDNPVIGNRSFSSDPHIAAELSGAFADGLRSSGIIPVFKHFPGHGDTLQDSHLELARTDRSAEEMRGCEWLPFQGADAGSGIMVGHIAAPALDDSGTPATLSPEIVSGILKEDLGFSGLVITDSLSMGAIAERYSSAEAAQRAFEAGCHLLLMPEDFRAAFSGMVSAVESGELSEEQLDQRVWEILRFKQEQLGFSPQ